MKITSGSYGYLPFSSKDPEQVFGALQSVQQVCIGCRVRKHAAFNVLKVCRQECEARLRRVNRTERQHLIVLVKRKKRSRNQNYNTCGNPGFLNQHFVPELR